MIQPSVLNRFAETFAAAGFDPRAFLPSYGMAEVCVGLSFGQPLPGLRLDQAVDPTSRRRARFRALRPGAARPSSSRSATRGRGARPERAVGQLFVRGPERHAGLFPASPRQRAGPEGRLARHRRPWLLVRRRDGHHRPGQGPDHRQRPQHLAAGHRMGASRRCRGCAAAMPAPSRPRRRWARKSSFSCKASSARWPNARA